MSSTVRVRRLITIEAWNVFHDETRSYGPFELVQLTYDLLRVDPNGDRELAQYSHEQDRWIFDDDFKATDIAFGVTMDLAFEDPT